jgi:hypothetical protein
MRRGKRLTFTVALLIASIHLALFRYLDSEIAEGAGQVVQQSYVTTASHILASGFQVSLQICLGSIFVQYLWYILRQSILPVSTIEALFTLRSTPMAIFHFPALKEAPILMALVIFIWTTYITTSFPPGALTVKSQFRTAFDMMSVPIFNASFVR